MKKQMLIKSLVAALSLIVAQACLGASAESIANRSQSGGYIVRAFGEPNDSFARDCMSGTPEWKKADAGERERLMEIGRQKAREIAKTHVAVAFMDVGVFLSHTAYAFAPKGSVQVGDEVTFRAVSPEDTPAAGCPNPEARVGKRLAVDKIIKHHSGSLLFANGKFIDKIPADGEQSKAESKPKPKSNPVLDL